VIVLPYAGSAAAKQMIQRVRIRIGAQVAASTGMPVFVSVGVAEWRREDSALDLLDAADRALIEAKRSGGARVFVSSSSPRRNGALVGLTRSFRRSRVDRQDSPGG